jgi:cell division protease FtsH
MPIDTEPNRRKMLPGFRRFGGGMLVLFILLLVLDFLILQGPRPPQVSYSDFMKQVAAGQVDRAIVSPNVLKPDPVLPGTTPGQVLVTRPVLTDLE